MAERTEVSSETEKTEELQGRAAHQADRLPTEDEATTADRTAEDLRESGESAQVAQHHREMDERGAHVRGEGQID